MTQAGFISATKPSTDTRSDLVSIIAQRRAKADARNQADAASRDTIQRVVAAVRADPNFGPDSPLLAAMSYVTRSARKTGKTNKTNGQATAAAVKSH
jgi:HJR/Mrr/RecB family endonuclease